MPDKELVLVTGASGFVALHCIHQLLQAGYRVRGTVRNLQREPEVRQTLASHLDNTDGLEIVEAELTRDAGWAEAVAGCDYVLHVASPFPEKPPKDDNDLIIPAREGALRVLRAAAAAGVKRLVLTSSIAAVAYGHSDRESLTFNEQDWSDLESGDVAAYERSKTMAERAAWEFMGSPDAGNMELSVINPGLVLGPVLGAHAGTSARLVKKILDRELPACPRLGFPIVDVRDVARAHISAMTVPAAAGKRFCCNSTSIWLVDLAKILHGEYAARGYKVPTGNMPDWLFRLAALFDKSLRPGLPSLGKIIEIDNRLIRDVLDWQPIGAEEMSIALADSLLEHGIVETK